MNGVIIFRNEYEEHKKMMKNGIILIKKGGKYDDLMNVVINLLIEYEECKKTIENIIM
jgi:hypothetical protein